MVNANRLNQFLLLVFPAVVLTLAINAINPVGADSRELSAQTTELKLGQKHQREIIGHRVDEFFVTLRSGYFCQITLERPRLGLFSVNVYRPDNQPLRRAITQSPSRMERISFIANALGRYRLEISRAASATLNRRKYQIELTTLRAIQPADAELIALEEALSDAERLRQEKTTPSYQQAIAQLQTTREKFKSVITAAHEINIHYGLGINRRLLNLPESRANFETALWLARQAGDQFNAAAMLFHLAESSQGAERLAFYKEALEQALASDNLVTASFTLINWGVTLEQQDEYQQAIANYEQAATLFREYHDWGGVMTAHANKAIVWQKLGDVTSALNAYFQTLEIARQVNFTPSQISSSIGIAFLYYSLGEMKTAREYYDQANQLSVADNNRKQQAIALTGLGATAAALGEREQARKFYDQALLLQRALNDRRNEGVTLGALSLLDFAEGRLTEARANLMAGLKLVSAAQDRLFEAAGLAKLGSVDAALGDWKSAGENFRAALALSRRIHDLRGQAEARYGLARVEQQAGNLAAARHQIETALNLIETQRARIPSHTLRSAYFASLQNYRELQIELLMAEHRQRPTANFAALGLQASERARARSLTEMLAEARVDLREGVEPALLQRERELQQLLNAASDRQFKLLSRLHLKSQADEAQRRIDRLTVELNETQSRIRAASPRFAALTAPPLLGLKDIQQQLDDQTTLLEFSLGEPRSYLWAVSKDSFASYELPPRNQIETQAALVRSLLTARQPVAGETETQRARRISDADARFPAEAAKLSRMLIAPAADKLNKPRLAIVADGALQYVPFAALPDCGLRIGDCGSKKPMITDHEIIYLPSVSALATLRREVVVREKAPKTLAVFADPVFERDDPRLARQRKSPTATVQRDDNFNQPFSRLLYSRREANRILSFVTDGNQRFSAMDFSANRAAAFDSQLSQYRLLHFATHGVLNELNPELSGVALSLLDEKGQSQDGFLRLHEIYNLKLNAELVSLSACQTGLGKDIRGEGLIGLTRGFMFAGSPRIAASLWKVQDDATAELMAEFYRGLLSEGKRPAEALRAAQLAMLKKTNWREPFFWAAFVLQGEWR